MPFGLTDAGNAFQCNLDKTWSKLDFVTGIADDMIIWKEQADRSDHDQYLTKILQDNTSWNWNMRKCSLKHQEVQAIKISQLQMFGTSNAF